MRVRKSQTIGDQTVQLVTAGDIKNVSSNPDLTENSLMWMKSVRGTAAFG